MTYIEQFIDMRIKQGKRKKSDKAKILKAIDENKKQKQTGKIK